MLICSKSNPFWIKTRRILAAYSIYKRRHGKSMIALGLFSVCIGFWRLMDTRFIPFVFPDRPVLVFYISVGMMMLGMVPLFKSLKENFGKRSCQIMDSFCIVNALICVLQLSLQIMGVTDLRESLIVTHLTIAAGTMLIVVNMVWELVTYPEKRKLAARKGLPFVVVAGLVADITAFYVKGNSSGLVFSLLGFLIYIMLIGIGRMFYYSEREIELLAKDRQLAENELQLTESRITAMMGQIRTHFVFNVLTAISGMCEYDPKKADDTLLCFARYLRRNIDTMLENCPEMFASSLQQLEDYIALQQVRFGDKIKLEKELGITDFMLPPMILQPIVENSIKHGILPKASGGTIQLRTESDGATIQITISDDGIGFDAGDPDWKEGVGLSNVRFRLQHMMNGRMCVDSIPGGGTRVTISIPLCRNKSEETVL